MIAKIKPCLFALACVCMLAAADPAAARARQLIWADEFNGAARSVPDPTKWKFDTGGGGWGNRELQEYTASPSNASLDGHGHLRMTARVEAGAPRRYTSARLQTLNTFQFTYGRFQARIRVPSGKGLVSGFWSLGSEAYEVPHAWPACGEIDAMEVRGADPGRLFGTLHGPWPWALGGIGGARRSPAPLSRGFHVYGVDWSPSRIAFTLDDKTYEVVRPSDLHPGSAWPFTHPFFLLLNLAVGGKFAGAPVPSTRFPAAMEVDWVRVWQ